MIVDINKDKQAYMKALATYMNTKEGRTFTFSIISQLIPEFEIDHKGRIKSAILNDKPVVIDFGEEDEA